MSPGETLARRFHEAYERLAPSFGYETRTETREFDPTTPNGKLMIAVCAEVAHPLPSTFVWPDDPEDLRPWGYAPGSYVFACKDCPADLDIYDKMGRLGDKRSWRCEEHARAAKVATPTSETDQLGGVGV